MNACSALKTIVPDQVCAFVGTGDYVEIPPACTFFEGKPATYANLLAVLNQSDVKGLLPNGLTELEYLESSGTQWINTRMYLHGNSRVEFEATPLQRTYVNFFFDTTLTSSNEGKFGVSFGYNGGYSDTLYYRYGNEAGRYCSRFADGSSTTLALGQKYHFEMYDGVLYKNGSGITRAYNGAIPIPIQEFTSAGPCFLFCSYGTGYAIHKSIMRLYSFTVKENDALLLNLIPAIRNADGVVGMWDSVKGKFYTNAGTGTFGYRIEHTGETVKPMSLRDPYYTAPSGVYARPSGENELEIIADTEETAGDGWEWFANTAEAYEHFNITIPE